MKSSKRSVTSKALALATGAGAVVFTGGAADGAVMIGNAPGINPIGTGSGAVTWDIDGGGVADFEFSGSTLSTSIILEPLAGASLNGTYSNLANLGTSFNLDATGSFTNPSFFLVYSGSISSATQFTDGVMGHIGFSFEIGGDTHFGYAEITITEGGNATAQVNVGNVFYESDANTAIHVGTIPEPSSLTLLALGAAGLAAWRRRRDGEND